MAHDVGSRHALACGAVTRRTAPLNVPGAPSRSSPAARMADHLAARIASGELAPGLPAARDRGLAAEYGVALGTARRAIEELRGRGLVVTLPAKGTFIAGAAATWD